MRFGRSTGRPFTACNRVSLYSLIHTEKNNPKGTEKVLLRTYYCNESNASCASQCIHMSHSPSWSHREADTWTLVSRLAYNPHRVRVKMWSGCKRKDWTLYVDGNVRGTQLESLSNCTENLQTAKMISDLYIFREKFLLVIPIYFIRKYYNCNLEIDIRNIFLSTDRMIQFHAQLIYTKGYFNYFTLTWDLLTPTNVWVPGATANPWFFICGASWGSCSWIWGNKHQEVLL